MKILLIQPTGDKFGHYGIHFTRMAQELAKLGHNVVVFTNQMQPRQFLEEEPLFSVVEHKRQRYAFEEFEKHKSSRPLRFWYGYFRNSLAITWAGLAYAKRHSFNAVYISDAEFLMASLVLKFNQRNMCPIVMQVNASNFSFSEYSGNVLKKAYKKLQASIFRTTIGTQITAISVLGDWHKQRLIKQLRITNGNHRVVVIGDASEPGVEMPTVAQARENLGIDFDGDIFLFLGILRQDKGLEVLAEALNGDALNREKFGVILAGHPFDYSADEITGMFQLDRSDSSIVHHILDYVPEHQLKDYYGAANAMLLPYNLKYKGSSGPLTKGACTYGLPTILSDVSEMGHIAKREGLGILVEPEDSEALGREMVKFLRMPTEDRQRISERCRDYGEANTWAKLAQRYDKLFRDIRK